MSAGTGPETPRRYVAKVAAVKHSRGLAPGRPRASGGAVEEEGVPYAATRLPVSSAPGHLCFSSQLRIF